MKFVKYYLPAIIGIFIGCLLYFVHIECGLFGYVVEQQVRETYFSHEQELATYIWYHGEIVYSFHDSIDSVLIHPNLKAQRREQANKLIASLRK